jgi:hypothetical protein
VWFNFGGEDIGAELRQIKEMMMAVNDDLAQVKTLLGEAGTEISAKLDELASQVGDAADPALVAEIKARAQGLADIVPNVPAEEPPAETPPTDEPTPA